jgi:hypothetical protein
MILHRSGRKPTSPGTAGLGCGLTDEPAGQAEFGIHCRVCPLADICTTSKTGPSITIGHHEERLTAARARHRGSGPSARFGEGGRLPGHPAQGRTYSPTLVRHRHGRRRARMRGTQRIAGDFALLAASVNLVRLATLGLVHSRGAWTLNPA